MRKLLVMVVCLAAALTHAETFTKPEVTLEVPDGWVEVPADVLQAFHDEMQRQAPLVQAPKYNYALQSMPGPPWLSYPYVLVKVTPSGRPTEHDLETLPTIDLNAKVREQGDAWSGLMKASSLGQMRYDKAANIVWLSSKSEVKSIGAVTGISGIIPTEQGFVELHGYAKDADFAQHLPTFQKIITGAKVAPHLQYQPRWTDQLGPAARFDFKWLGFLAAIGALVGISVATYRRRKS
jgi:hypothetical protein